VIIHLEKSVVKQWISNGERETRVNKPRILGKKICVVGYMSVGIKLLVKNGEGHFDLTKKNYYK
jgi:hypothetical protein